MLQVNLHVLALSVARRVREEMSAALKEEHDIDDEMLTDEELVQIASSLIPGPQPRALRPSEILEDIGLATEYLEDFRRTVPDWADNPQAETGEIDRIVNIIETVRQGILSLSEN